MKPGPQGTRRRLAAFLGVSALAVALAWLANRSPLPAPPPRVEKVRIALPQATAAALIHIAVARRYFADEGLDVTIVPATHGKAAFELLASDAADLAAAADVVFVLSVARGQDPHIVANMLAAPRDNAIVARRDRGIAAPADLAGKRVGVPFGTAADYFLWALLVRHKVDPASVTGVDLPPGRIVEALAAGTVDAVALWHPGVLDAAAALGANGALFFAGGAYTESFVVAGRGEFIARNPQAMQKLVRALLKAERWLASRPEEALVLVAARLGTDAATLRPAWKDFNFRLELSQSQLHTLENQARWAMARGYAPAGPVPNFLARVHLDALLAVEPRRVTMLH